MDLATYDAIDDTWTAVESLAHPADANLIASDDSLGKDFLSDKPSSSGQRMMMGIG